MPQDPMKLESSFVELPGFDPAQAEPDASLLVGDRLVVCDRHRLAAISVTQRAVLWQVSKQPPAPEYFRVARRTTACGCQLWAEGERVVHLADAPGGVVLTAHELGTGRLVWQREFETPPPLPFTESSPAYDGAHTEELSAFLGATEELVLAVARTSRRSLRWPGGTLPPFRAQLELVAPDAQTGELRWQSSFPDVAVPILEKRRWANCFAAVDEIRVLSPATGVARTLRKLPGSVGWPRWCGSQVVVSWHKGGSVGVCWLDAATGEVVRQGQWKRKGVKETEVWVRSGRTYLRINDQFLCLLNEEPAPAWEVRAKPYIYGVARGPLGPVWIATAGQGGALYAIDEATGAELRRVVVPGGVADVRPLVGTEYLASTTARGIALAHATTMELVHHDLPGARHVAGNVGSTIVVVSGEPRPGVQFVEVP
jgi:hypothetical protein